MSWIVKNLWLIPALPLLAAGLSALAPQRCRKFSASLAIGSMIGAFLLSLCAFAHTLHVGHEGAKEVFNFDWFRFIFLIFVQQLSRTDSILSQIPCLQIV